MSFNGVAFVYRDAEGERGVGATRTMGRKSVALTVEEPGISTVVGYFRSEEDATLFCDAIRRLLKLDIIMKGG
jgi:hypothetical protein